MPENETACTHDDFAATVNVILIGEHDPGNPNPGQPRGYQAEIRVCCLGCQSPFVFVGAPAGLSFAGPMVSPDGTELRAPMRPGTASDSFGRDLPGYHINASIPDDRAAGEG